MHARALPASPAIPIPAPMSDIQDGPAGSTTPHWRTSSGKWPVPPSSARREHAPITGKRRRLERPISRPVAPVTVLVPAYNEAASVGDTIRSLQAQTLAPAEIIVIDDCSTDDTAAVARALGVRVLRPSKNTGSKAGAQNYALHF